MNNYHEGSASHDRRSSRGEDFRRLSHVLDVASRCAHADPDLSKRSARALGFGSPAGGLIGLPISFLLKNKLHLQTHEMAVFALIAGAPAYVSFLFGFARDIWNPFGMGDRGYMVLFGGLCAALYVMFAFAPVNYRSLLIANLLLGTAFLFVSSA
jgi:hypothetical protein